jgi:hypothetical protein
MDNETITIEWPEIRDEKGRLVSGFATLHQPQEMPHYPAGHQRYGVRVFAQRNGERFGASPRTTYHTTEAQARAHAHKALRTQQARYLKKYGKGVGQ